MSKTTLKVLGCGDAFGSGGRFNTCFYVKSPGLNFLIDCGATSLVALKKNGISTNDIDTIFISHFHGDHYGGLPFFLLDATIPSGRKKPLTIVSPQGLKKKLEELITLLYPGSENILKSFPLKFIEYKKHEEVQLENCTVTAYPVLHNKKTLPHALKIKLKNKAIGFSGDTEWTEELVKVAGGVDLFLCECNFYDLKIKGHLDYKTILKNKEKLKCKKMLLTHFGEQMLKNLKNTDIPYAEDGMETEV